MAEGFIILALTLPVVVLPVNLLAFGVAGTRARLPRLLPQGVTVVALFVLGAWIARTIGEVPASIVVFSGALLMTWQSRRDPAARADEALIATILKTGRGRWLLLLIAADLLFLIVVVAITMGGP